VAGARGLMTAMAVIAPELCLQLHVLAKQQRWEEARALNDRLLPLGNFLETGRFVPFAKAAMARTGLPVGLPRRPALPISESDERSLCETMTPLARLVD
jgi:4-hydroxy-tetrahydrodipicolinate synthase